MPHKVLPELSRLQIVRDYQNALTGITGIAFRLVPAHSAESPPCESLHPFCALMWGHRIGCEFCRKVSGAAQERAGRDQTPQEIACLAGIKEVVVPIMMGTEHIASLFAGPLFTKKPQLRQFRRLAKELKKWGVQASAKNFEKTFAQARILTPGQLAGMVRLLTVFANHLSQAAGHLAIDSSPSESATVRHARDFAAQVLDDRPVTAKDAASFVHLSASHFSKMFHKATGWTFRDYLAHIRVEKAKQLLSNGCDRATDAAFAAGFNSIPTFNRVFKKITGLSPMEFHRAAKRGE